MIPVEGRALRRREAVRDRAQHRNLLDDIDMNAGLAPRERRARQTVEVADRLDDDAPPRLQRDHFNDEVHRVGSRAP